MKNEDRISEILSDSNGLEPETLEKISENCNVLSEEQKNRILNLISEKENRTETEKNDENPETIRVIEYRKKDSVMKIIAAVAACACLVTGVILAGNKTENINTYNNDMKTTTYGTAKITDVSESTNDMKTTTAYETTKITDVSKSTNDTKTTTVYETTKITDVSESTADKAQVITSETKTEVTAVVTVTEPLETAVQPEAFSEEPEVQVTGSVKTLKNLKDDVFKEYWGYSNPVQNALVNAGFNEDQAEKMKRIGIFTKFADHIESLVYPAHCDENSNLLTGYSYDSFCELIDYFFADGFKFNGRNNIEFYPENADGELKILCGTPVCHYPSTCEVTVTESTDSYVKFTLHCGVEADLVMFDKYIEKYDNPAEVVAAFNENENWKYWGPNIRGAAYSESKGYLIMYDYEEEMVNTDDGWKFSVYNDYRRG